MSLLLITSRYAHVQPMCTQCNVPLKRIFLQAPINCIAEDKSGAGLPWTDVFARASRSRDISPVCIACSYLMPWTALSTLAAILMTLGARDG